MPRKPTARQLAAAALGQKVPRFVVAYIASQGGRYTYNPCTCTVKEDETMPRTKKAAPPAKPRSSRKKAAPPKLKSDAEGWKALARAERARRGGKARPRVTRAMGEKHAARRHVDDSRSLYAKVRASALAEAKRKGRRVTSTMFNDAVRSYAEKKLGAVGVKLTSTDWLYGAFDVATKYATTPKGVAELAALSEIGAEIAREIATTATKPRRFAPKGRA